MLFKKFVRGGNRREQVVRRAVTEALESRQLLAGDGLSATYYNNANFTGTTATRVDATVNFNWGTGRPMSAIAPDSWSTRWTGQIVPQYTETYTFHATTDDGVRLWVDGKQIINNWKIQAATTTTGTVTLQAGKPHNIVMEYYENGGPAVAKLEWSSPSQARQVVPTSALYSTAAPAPVAPAAPSALTAQRVSASQVNLTWADNSTNETGFKIERSTDGSTWTQIGTVGANVKTYSATGLSSGTNQFRVRAYNATGNSAYSNMAAASDSAMTSIAEDFSVGAGNFTVVDGTWSVVNGAYQLGTPSTAATTHLSNRSVHNTSVNGDFTLNVQATPTATAAAWNNAAVIFGYQDPNNYYFVSFNESNDAATSGIFKVVNGVSTELADITTPIVAGQASRIRVQRVGGNIEAYLNNVLVASATDTTFTAGRIGLGTRQYAASFDNLTVTWDSGTAPVAPVAPSDLLAVAASASRIDLAWTDNSADESGFRIERSTDGGATWTQQGAVGAGVTSFAATGLTASTAYQFRVRAYNTAGNSGYSNTASATTSAAPAGQSPYGGSPRAVPGVIQAEDFDLGGEGVAFHDDTAANEGGMYRPTEGPDIADGGMADDGTHSVGWLRTGEWMEYTVQVATAGTYTLGARVSATVANAQFRVEVDGADVTGAMAVPNTGAVGTWATVEQPGVTLAAGTHVLRMYVMTGGFNLNYLTLATAAAPTIPSAPTGLTATATSSSRIDLRWSDTSTNESGFKIERSTNGGTTWTQVGTVASNISSYAATSLSASTAYAFRVRAYNAAGDSAYTGTASATTPAAPSVGAKPTAANTGLAVSGISESSLQVISGRYTARAGEVLEGKHFTGGVVIPAGANNVVIRNSLVSGGQYGIQSMDGAQNLLVENVEIRGTTGKGMLVHNATVRRVYIHDVGSDGMFIHNGGNVTVEYSFIERCGRNNPTDHTDGIQVHTPGQNIVIRYNNINLPDTLYSQPGWGALNSCIVFQSDWGSITNSRIEGNWLNGGGYTIRLEEKGGYDISGITVSGNRFGRDFQYAPRGTIGSPGFTWTSNVYDDNGATIS
jgi:hypothetical protein